MKLESNQSVHVVHNTEIEFLRGRHPEQLPTEGAPGSWMSGTFHLFEHVSIAVADVAYLVEFDPESVLSKRDGYFVARKIRLLRELTRDELASLNVFSEGDHIVRDGFARAYDRATVRAGYGAMVIAYGNAIVYAYSNSTVRASDGATVRAYDDAIVRADDKTVVTAHGKVVVHAYDNATVRACDRSVCTAWRGDGLTLIREGESVIIDRRNGEFIVNGVDMKAAK